MPTLLAQEVEAITRTLDTLMTVDLPRLMIIFFILLVLAIIANSIVSWRVSNNKSRGNIQQLQLTAQTMTNLNDYLKVEQGTTQVKLDLAIQEIRQTHKAVMNNYAIQNTAIEGLAHRVSELFSVMDTQLESMQKRFIVTEAETQDRWTKVTEVGQRLKTEMSQVSKTMAQVETNDQETIIELRKLREEFTRIADNMEQMRIELAAIGTFVNKMTKANPLTVIKTEPKETPDNA